jgi:uncharacterized protein (DUF488 family)
MTEALTIFTIGHSVHPLDGFIDLLKDHQIQVLVDVRTSPTSGYSPQFNQASLKDGLTTAGIKYLFLGKELGGRPNGEHPTSLADKMYLYRRVRTSEAFQVGLARMGEGVKTHRIALMCSEEDPEACHRHLLIAPALEDLGLAVVHIRGDGSTP